MDKLNKLSLPATIIIASLILGGAFYAIQVNKQQSIEKQQQIELQAKTEADKIKAEQNKRDYIAKRKIDCLAMYKTESDKFNNVHSWSYLEPFVKKNDGSLNYRSLNSIDKCEIIYKNDKTGETFSRYY